MKDNRKTNRPVRGWRYPLGERKQQLIEFAGTVDEFTVSQAASYLGVQPSQHLRQIIWDMVDDGRLIAWPRQHWNGWPKWVFEIHQEGVGDE